MLPLPTVVLWPTPLLVRDTATLASRLEGVRGIGADGEEARADMLADRTR